MQHMLSDLRHALRQVLRRPLFLVVAGGSLAIGVGVNAGLFGAANALLLRPASGVDRPDRLVDLGRTMRGRGFDTFAYPDFEAVRDQVDAFEAVAAYDFAIFSFSQGEGGERITGLLASPDYFRVMGLLPESGRFFTPEEDRPDSDPAVVVVSHDFWTSRLGARADVVGTTLLINRIAFEVVGVAPAAFHGHHTGFRPDVFVPIRARPLLREGRDLFGSRGASWHMVVARLRPGATVEEADAQVKAVYARLAEAYPDTNGERSATVVPLGPVPGPVRAPVRAFLAALLGLTSLILLVTCANVAGMFVARASHREKEIAVRLALGAGRGRLVRQLLVEALVVFVLGGALGTAVAILVLGSLPLDRLPVPIPLSVDLSPDLTVLALAAGVTLLTGTAFGLLPALQATRLDLTASLKDNGSTRGRRAGFLRRFFVGGQVGLSVLLLASAGLFLRSLQRAAEVETGFDPTGAWATSIDLSMEGYSAEEAAALQERIVTRLAALPGVEAVALAGDLPLDMGNRGTEIVPEGWTGDGTREYTSTEFDAVTSGYFRALGIPLLRGRAFGDDDTHGSEPVVVVSRTFVDTYWPGEDGLGRRMRFWGGDEPWRTVVGVVEDVKNTFITDMPEPMTYIPIPQVPQLATQVVVRAPGVGEALAPAVRRAILEVDPTLSMTPVISLARASGLGVLPQRVAAGITSALGALALLLSALGVYGVVASAIAQRTRELGVRLALGAGRTRLLTLVLRQGIGLALPGLLVGLPASVALGFVLRSFLLGLSPFDPVALLLVPAALLAAVLAASAVPARRAAAIQPTEALRSE